MQVRTWIAGSVLISSAVVAACSSTIDASSEGALASEPAQLVAQKRAWLEAYDAHCSSCFQAFELCEQGADASEQDECKVALDACVRGGLLAKAAAEDAGAGLLDPDAIDEDAGDPDDVLDDDLLADAGIDVGDDGDLEEVDDDDLADGNGGRVFDGDRDRDVVFDEDPDQDVDADAGVDEDVDQDADEDADEAAADDAADQDAAKAAIKQAVEACLDQAQVCLDDDATVDAQQCVSPLQACVKQSLEGTFDQVCEQQVRRCRKEGGSPERLRNVERQCQQNLRI